MKTVSTNIRLTPDQRQRLREMAHEDGTTLAGLVAAYVLPLAGLSLSQRLEVRRRAAELAEGREGGGDGVRAQ